VPDRTRQDDGRGSALVASDAHVQPASGAATSGIRFQAGPGLFPFTRSLTHHAFDDL
jgi:hypothetical protein